MEIVSGEHRSRQTRWAAATNTALSALTVIVVAVASGLAIGVVSLRLLIPIEPAYDPALPLDRAPQVTAGDGQLSKSGVL